MLIQPGDEGSISFTTSNAITFGFSIGLTFGENPVLGPDEATGTGQLSAGFTWVRETVVNVDVS
jgi:hypothetical protein